MCVLRFASKIPKTVEAAMAQNQLCTEKIKTDVEWRPEHCVFAFAVPDRSDSK